jgi:hypothetical protein
MARENMLKVLSWIAVALLVSSSGCASAVVRRNATILKEAERLPDLGRVMEAYVPVKAVEFGPEYLGQMRSDIVAPLRDLRAKGLIGWYGFLLHGCPQNLVSSATADACVHLLLERGPGVDPEEFRAKAPPQFRNIDGSGPSNIAGLDRAQLKDSDWTYAWKLIGQSSAWVVELLSTHGDSTISPEQLVQFMHYITNPLFLGGQFEFLPLKKRF